MMAACLIVMFYVSQPQFDAQVRRKSKVNKLALWRLSIWALTIVFVLVAFVGA